MNAKPVRCTLTLLPVLALALIVLPQTASAHCDALDGPVVNDARAALVAGDVAPVLKWIAAKHEDEVSAALKQALIVRTQGPEAQQLADRYFFETVVRLHRAFEGAPYTGLKPAGMDHGASVHAADAALATGSVEELRSLIIRDVERGLEERFHALLYAREHADHNPEAGRAFVHAYVEFVHYAKRLYENASSSDAHSDGHVH